jgi:hypothetical protein
VGLDAVDSGDGYTRVDHGDGATDPRSRELAVVDNAACVRLPRLCEQVKSEQVKTLKQATLGVCIELRGAMIGPRRERAELRHRCGAAAATRAASRSR